MDYIQPAIPKTNLNKKSLNRKKDDTYVDISKRIFISTTGIRNFLLQEYERELPIIHKIQSYRNSFFDFYFGLASLLGEEIFYILSLPSSTWFFTRQLSFHLTLVLAMSIGLGNIMKNIFQLPRPRGVWTNTAPQNDHGLPSTHTSSALSISLYFYVYCYLLYPETSKDFFIGSAGALFLVMLWSFSVMFSRLYNGHHTPMDVITGFCIGLGAVAVMTYKLRFIVDAMVANPSPLGIATYVMIMISVILFHPQPRVPNAAYPETGLVCGTGLGPYLAGWMDTHIISTAVIPEGFVSQYPVINFIRSNKTLLNLLRLVVGVTIVLLVKIFSKKLYYFIYHLIYGKPVSPKKSDDVKLASPVTGADQHKQSQPVNQHISAYPPMVEAFGKLFVYTCVSFAICIVCKNVFYILQLTIPLDYINIPN